MERSLLSFYGIANGLRWDAVLEFLHSNLSRAGVLIHTGSPWKELIFQMYCLLQATEGPASCSESRRTLALVLGTTSMAACVQLGVGGGGVGAEGLPQARSGSAGEGGACEPEAARLPGKLSTPWAPPQSCYALSFSFLSVLLCSKRYWREGKPSADIRTRTFGSPGITQRCDSMTWEGD